MKPGYVHLLTNEPGGVLCIGVTDDLARRVEQHRSRAVPGFTRNCDCHAPVGLEVSANILAARVFERRMKKRNRDGKTARIIERTPDWHGVGDSVGHV